MPSASSKAALVFLLVAPAVVAPFACGGQSGEPAAPYALAYDSYDAGTPNVEASSPPAPLVDLPGRVLRAGSDAGVAGAFVVVEVDGLEADGGAAAMMSVDPNVRYGGVTDGTGTFDFRVPAGKVGLHALSPAYIERRQNVTTGASPDAAVVRSVVALSPLASVDGGGGDGGGDGGSALRPTATRLNANPVLVAPLTAITFAIDVAAGSSADPLSRDIFLVEPTTQWAGALAPPTPALASGASPDGDYGLLVEAPSLPGVYTYTVVAASLGGVTSEPASVVVTVTATGAPPVPDSGLSPDGAFLGDGGP